VSQFPNQRVVINNIPQDLLFQGSNDPCSTASRCSVTTILRRHRRAHEPSRVERMRFVSLLPPRRLLFLRASDSSVPCLTARQREREKQTVKSRLTPKSSCWPTEIRARGYKTIRGRAGSLQHRPVAVIERRRIIRSAGPPLHACPALPGARGSKSTDPVAT
jgi:hypothetical protein